MPGCEYSISAPDVDASFPIALLVEEVPATMTLNPGIATLGSICVTLYSGVESAYVAGDEVIAELTVTDSVIGLVADELVYPTTFMFIVLVELI